MATPKTVVWEQDPHTAEKLKILRYYLDAWWTIILSSRFARATHVDGFAGPGEYKNGEDGSPAVAIRALLSHQDKTWWGKRRAGIVLKEAGFTYRLAFELVDEGGRGFFLIHGTSSLIGLERMKEAMWRVDPVRGVRFQDPRDPNQTWFDIGPNDPDLRGLENLLAEKLSDGSPAEVDALQHWALTETVFLKKHVLRVLRNWRDRHKKQPVLVVLPPGGQLNATKTVQLLRQPPRQRVSERGMFDLSPGG